MRLVVRSLLAVSLVAGALACGDSLTESQSVAARLTGTWSEPPGLPPGSSLIMILAAHDTVVSGTGTYRFEAGRSGSMTIAGSVSGKTIDFDVTFDYGRVMHFHGGLTVLTQLRGIWYGKPVGDPVNIEFDKVR